MQINPKGIHLEQPNLMWYKDLFYEPQLEVRLYRIVLYFEILNHLAIRRSICVVNWPSLLSVIMLRCT